LATSKSAPIASIARIPSGGREPRNEQAGTVGDQRNAVARFVRLDTEAAFPLDVLALGADLKSTVCLGRAQTALLSDSLGDLAEADGLRLFDAEVQRLKTHLARRGFVVGHDLHPGYISTQYARNAFGRGVPVQHHHAHAVSCAIDRGVPLPVIGVICDGTGYGTDGAIWGGEVLCCDADSFRRAAHLLYFGIPGGDAAARSPWRSALGAMKTAFPDDWIALSQRMLHGVNATEREVAVKQLECGLNVARTSSLGRLFDAVAALTGVCLCNASEGQAAMALQQAARSHDATFYPIGQQESSDAAIELDWRPMLREIVTDVARGVNAGAISSRFHATIIAMFSEAACHATTRASLGTVVLSGGCFMNELLRQGIGAQLSRRGLVVVTHRRVSTGDAGLSLGQAMIASHIAIREGRFSMVSPGARRCV
jgi:hydrogenase maturation protein HypF